MPTFRNIIVRLIERTVRARMAAPVARGGVDHDLAVAGAVVREADAIKGESSLWLAALVQLVAWAVECQTRDLTATVTARPCQLSWAGVRVYIRVG